MAEPFDIAVIGMAGRFPGAGSTEALWSILRDGRETITRYDRPRRGYTRRPQDAPGRFVPAGGVLESVDRFDNEFFGIHPREAENMDPQHRIFLECAWHALEDAGYAGARKPVTGLFAACGPSAYLLSQFCREEQWIDHLLYRTGIATAVLNGNEPELLPLRTAYKLDLRGPVINVQTACSSSLVAVAQACQSLAGFETDMCLAGGIHVRSSDVQGYYHQPGGILSSDGRCRPFDRSATGTVFGDGAGIVVLRRLEDAVAAGDRVDAVIKGWAVNNDGGKKGSLSAPSAEGQEAVVLAAHSLANVTPDSIQYVEAHGTGTVVGDAIELAALTRAWGDRNGPRCGIGSIKSNIGHLDAAAGVAGLIKTILCLGHRRLVPSLHCNDPLPGLTDASSPFYAVREARDWPDSEPARAGVSSLGVGGTNCHVVLERWTDETDRPESRATHLLTLSARSTAALDELVERFGAFLEAGDPNEFGDICYTSNVGRAHFPLRLAVAAQGIEECRERLAAASQHGGGYPSPRADARAFSELMSRYERGDIARARLFDEAAALYGSGAEIDWVRLHGEHSRRRAALPLYPFEDHRHWRSPGHGGRRVLSRQANGPASGARIPLPFSSEARFHHRLHSAYPEYLPHHLLFDTIVVPASAHLSLLLSAWRELHGGIPGALEKIHFIRPLTVPDDGALEMQLILPDTLHTGSAVRVVAAGSGDWEEFVLARTAPASTRARALDTDAIAAQCEQRLDGSVFYRDVWAQGDGTGASFRWIRTLGAADGVACGQIARPEDCLGDQDPHPGLIEGLFQLLYCCRSIETRPSVSETRTVLVPALIERLAWHGAVPGSGTGFARIRPSTPGSASVVGDLELVDPDGRVVLEIEGFELRPLGQEVLSGEPPARACTVTWRAAPLARRETASGSGEVILLGNDMPISKSLAKRLAPERRVHLWTDPAAPEDGSADRFVESLSPGAPAPTELVYLRPLAVDFDPDSGDVGAAMETALGGLFHLVKTLGRLRGPKVRVTIVTKRAQSVLDDESRRCPLQSMIWGLARTAARESPGIELRLIDIDGAGEPAVNGLHMDILQPDGEWQVAYRDGDRYCARLTPVHSFDGTAPPCGRYVVAGQEIGQGALIVESLQRHGIEAAATAGCHEFEDPGRLATDSSGGSPSGIIHTGASIGDGMIANSCWREFRDALRAELESLLRLHRSTATPDVGDFVLFSSAASVAGNPGQSAYAAAGMFSDGLAAYRRSRGLAGRSLSWGPWSSVGKWPRLTDRQKSRLLAEGIKPLSAAEALTAFNAFRCSAAVHGCIPGIEWDRFVVDDRLAPFFCELRRIDDTPAASRADVASRDEPGRRLRAILAEQAGLDDDRLGPDISLRDLGIDSLDAVNLIESIQNAFGVDLSLGDVVDAGNIGALAARIAAEQHRGLETESTSELSAPPAPSAAVGCNESIVVPVRAGTDHPPLFCVPADSSTALSMKPFCDNLKIHRPVYVFQAPGIDNGEQTPEDIAGIAERYVLEMSRAQPRGPYTLIGRCTGGLIAYQMALHLQGSGREVGLLVLLDTLPPRRVIAGVDGGVHRPLLGDTALVDRQERIDRDIRARIQGMPGGARTRFQRVQNALDEGIRTYSPVPAFAGRGVYIRSEQDVHPVQRLWDHMFIGGLQYIDVPGDHGSMFEPPYLEMLCDAVIRAVETDR